MGAHRPRGGAEGRGLSEAEADEDSAERGAADAPRRPDGARWLNFYGRRHGKTLRPGQRDLLDTRLAALAPPGVSPQENPTRRPVDPATLVPGARDLWVEVGFGGGEHLVADAAAHPEIGFVGCEPFVNGVAMFLAQMVRAGVTNVRVWPDDARLLFEVLPAASVGRLYLLYPDPWPKRRHARRRFVDDANLAEIARLLRPGAEFRVATDVAAYADHVRGHLAVRPEFAAVEADPATPWPGWPGTRYEAKARAAGRAPSYLRYVRR